MERIGCPYCDGKCGDHAQCGRLDDCRRTKENVEMKKYQVIGGQYESYWYGESDSLRGAKIIAGRNMEYWDNWQGWHRPSIYRAEDVEEIVAKGWITHRDGETIRVPKDFAEAIA